MVGGEAMVEAGAVTRRCVRCNACRRWLLVRESLLLSLKAPSRIVAAKKKLNVCKVDVFESLLLCHPCLVNDIHAICAAELKPICESLALCIDAMKFAKIWEEFYVHISYDMANHA